MEETFMLKFIKSFFSGKTEAPAPVAPYKVEAPASPVVDTPPTVAKQSVEAEPAAAPAPAKKARKTKAAGGASVSKTTKAAKAKKATKSK